MLSLSAGFACIFVFGFFFSPSFWLLLQISYRKVGGARDISTMFKVASRKPAPHPHPVGVRPCLPGGGSRSLRPVSRFPRRLGKAQPPRLRTGHSPGSARCPAHREIPESAAGTLPLPRGSGEGGAGSPSPPTARREEHPASPGGEMPAGVPVPRWVHWKPSVPEKRPAPGSPLPGVTCQQPHLQLQQAQALAKTCN